jgi:nicotinate phosphoribosyltransferase
MFIHSPLLTDQYQLVMACSYWQLGKANQEAVFHLYFRNHPFEGDYTICCGLDRVIDFISHWHFSDEEIAYLRKLKAPDQQALFSKEFLNYLSKLKFTGDIDAIPEGNIVFPNEPLLRIKAPILQCQLLETALINFMNFGSLIATKAARVCQAAQGDEVIEFGLRRAQGPDGGMLASRAAFLGGCASTSNVLAGKTYGIPVKGTQAHSWIMAFDDELSAFENFAKVMSGNVILLVDTYDTVQGVKNAIIVGKKLQQQNHKLLAVRLDSGDIVKLSQQTRQLLDQAGFTETKILASGDLDEYLISKMKSEGAKVDIWGVGTRLVTAYDQPAMNMIYKLSALRDAKQHWQYKIKISDDPNKTTTPGIHQVRRFYHQQKFVSDVIYDVDLGISEEMPDAADQAEDLLVPIFRRGELVYALSALKDSQEFCARQLKYFLRSDYRNYSIQLEPRLKELKQQLIGK